LRPRPKKSASKVQAAIANRLGFLSDDVGDREDWTRSVLLAAELDEEYLKEQASKQ